MTKTKLLNNKAILLIILLFFIPFLGFTIKILYSSNSFVFEYDSNEYNYGIQDFYVNYRLTLMGIVLSMIILISIMFVFYYNPEWLFRKKKGVFLSD